VAFINFSSDEESSGEAITKTFLRIQSFDVPNKGGVIWHKFIYYQITKDAEETNFVYDASKFIQYETKIDNIAEILNGKTHIMIEVDETEITFEREYGFIEGSELKIKASAIPSKKIARNCKVVLTAGTKKKL
jgi:hypothetical protein